jgi:hypothetical protein
MTTSKPIPCRWTEEAEAEKVCGLAVLEREPQSAAVRLVGCTAAMSSPAALLRWLLNCLADPSVQIRRDDDWQGGLS